MALCCESRVGLFRPCGEPAVAVCAQCQRSFCGRHGARMQNGEWVCGRQRCQMKATVVHGVLSARGRARLRNADGLCGAAPCGARWPVDACALCHGRYCVVHLNRRALRVLDSLNDRGAGSYRTERVLLCDQCVDLLDQYRLITLPPVPEAHPGLPPDGASVTVATPSAPTSPSPADTPSIGR